VYHIRLAYEEVYLHRIRPVYVGEYRLAYEEAYLDRIRPEYVGETRRRLYRLYPGARHQDMKSTCRMVAKSFNSTWTNRFLHVRLTHTVRIRRWNVTLTIGCWQKKKSKKKNTKH
jgi:hypothetical protein